MCVFGSMSEHQQSAAPVVGCAAHDFEQSGRGALSQEKLLHSFPHLILVHGNGSTIHDVVLGCGHMPQRRLPRHWRLHICIQLAIQSARILTSRRARGALRRESLLHSFLHLPMVRFWGMATCCMSACPGAGGCTHAVSDQHTFGGVVSQILESTHVGACQGRCPQMSLRPCPVT